MVGGCGTCFIAPHSLCEDQSHQTDRHQVCAPSVWHIRLSGTYFVCLFPFWEVSWPLGSAASLFFFGFHKQPSILPPTSFSLFDSCVCHLLYYAVFGRQLMPLPGSEC